MAGHGDADLHGGPRVGFVTPLIPTGEAATRRGQRCLGFTLLRSRGPVRIAARISGTASEQNRSATASNRVAISRGHLTAKGSGPNSLLPRTTPRPSAADSSDGRLQTGELGPGQDDLDHLVPFKRYRERSAASTSNDSANRCVAKSSAARTSRNFSSGVSGGSFTPGQYHELPIPRRGEPLEASMNLTDVLP